MLRIELLLMHFQITVVIPLPVSSGHPQLVVSPVLVGDPGNKAASILALKFLSVVYGRLGGKGVIQIRFVHVELPLGIAPLHCRMRDVAGTFSSDIVSFVALVVRGEACFFLFLQFFYLTRDPSILLLLL